MINKKDSSDPIDNLEYEKVLEEEIIHTKVNFRKILKKIIKRLNFTDLKELQ